MLRLELRPSRCLCLVFVCTHAAAAAMLMTLELSPGMRVVLLAGIGASLVRALRRHAWLRSADAITAIELEEDHALLRRRDGRCEYAQLLESTYVSPCWTVLNLKVAGYLFAQHIVIVPDNVEEEGFRRARVWLRWAYRED